MTPLSYKHLMLEDVQSGEPTVLPGPMLVHQQMKFASFNYLASSLIDGNKNLRNVQAFGTDGDVNLSEALGHNFPIAVSQWCFIHFERNLLSKLKELGIPHKVAEEYVRDIFGSWEGNKYQKGLVDCKTISEFNQSLAGLEIVWNAREKPFCGLPPPCFAQYFKQHKAEKLMAWVLLPPFIQLTRASQ